MNTLHKYLLRQVLASLLLGMVVFTFVLLIGDGLKEILPLLIGGQVRPGVVLEAIGLLIPFFWVYALPMGLLTATLLVFGRFSADQELTAARASGISLLSLVTPVLLLSVFCCGLSAWINLDLGPRSRVAFKKLTVRERADLARLQLPERQFIRDFPGYIVYVNSNHGGDLEGLTVWVLQQQTNVTSIIWGSRGRLDVENENKQLVLHLLNSHRLTFLPNGASRNDFIPGWFSYPYPLPPTEKNSYHPAITDMTFWQLQNELDDLNRKLSLPPDLDEMGPEGHLTRFHEAEKQREDLTEPLRVEMHRQVAFSFACFSFTLIGIPLGIRVQRRETNVGVAMALILVLIYYAFIMVGESLSARPEFAPHLIFWLPNFIFQAVGAVLLWRANRGI